ncbi:MAG TPA: uroporphyrinogen-III C-methyltransferase [Burkholderiales bacterium]|nr:uroporphyrinogen-III C-methyltransferase [Burkholderiales bacterium]
MNPDPQGAESTAQPQEASPPKPERALWISHLKSLATFPTVSIAVVIVLLGAVWLDGRSRMGALQQELAKQLADTRALGQESRQMAVDARQALRDLEFKVGGLESRVSETQNQRLALESLYLELSRNRDERVLAEVEQILLLGAQQLQLAGNLKAALIALESADNRLQRADSLQFTALRRAISRDIERLKSAPFVDLVGMSVRLDAIAHRVDEMPLAMYQRPVEDKTPPPPAKEGAFVRVAREAWREIKSLVRVEKIDVPEVPLLSPSQQFFLRENLRMRLLSARIALLARDETSFRADVRSAQDWLKRYFDSRDRHVATSLDALKQLAEMEVKIDLPTTLDSLEAVRNQKLVRERGLR